MKKELMLLLLSTLISWNISSQVDALSKQVIDGVIIYKDIKTPLLYYYAPSKLQLVVDENEKPDFQMLKMRYIGTQCSNDADRSHTTNIVKLRIEMPPQSKSVLTEIKKKLNKNKSIKLKPIRITSIDSKLIVLSQSSDSISKHKALGESNSTTSDGKTGLSTTKAYWTERAFTFSLTNGEAELLETQLKDNTLALSFSYSFYANTTDPLDYVEISSSFELEEKEAESEDELKLINRIILSDAFELKISTQKWPEIIQEVDINESIPPTYAAIEIKCFDFCENLRPNLYIKKIEVAATSVDGSKEIIVETKFHKKHTDINTKYIHFPYAVLVGEPMKYRLTEITNEGQTNVGKWIGIESCSSILDVTTPADELTCEINDLEIEVAKSWFAEEECEIKLLISYSMNGELKYQYVDFDAKSFTKEISFFHDINSEIYYQINQVIDSKINYKSSEILLTDNYLYVNKLP